MFWDVSIIDFITIISNGHDNDSHGIQADHHGQHVFSHKKVPKHHCPMPPIKLQPGPNAMVLA